MRKWYLCAIRAIRSAVDGGNRSELAYAEEHCQTKTLGMTAMGRNSLQTRSLFRREIVSSDGMWNVNGVRQLVILSSVLKASDDWPSEMVMIERILSRFA